MKLSVNFRFLLCSSFIVAFSGCGPVRSLDTWEEFGKDVADAGRRHQVLELMTFYSCSHSTITEWISQAILRENSNYRRADPAHIPSRSDYLKWYEEDVKLFIRSYDHILDGELVRVTVSPTSEVKGIDQRAVVLWIKKDGRFHGIVIDQVVKTPWGIKVVDWNGVRGDLPKKQTASLERDQLKYCFYPPSIIFTYERYGREPASSLTKESLTVKNDRGCTPLHEAAEGHLDQIQQGFFTQENLTSKDDYGLTPLHIAAEYGQLGRIPQRFLTQQNLTIADSSGRTPLHEAAHRCYLNQVPKILLTEGNLTLKDHDGNTPLHFAACTGQLDLIAGELLTRENLTLKNNEGYTPIHRAIQWGHIDQIPKNLITEDNLTIMDSDGQVRRITPFE